MSTPTERALNANSIKESKQRTIDSQRVIPGHITNPPPGTQTVPNPGSTSGAQTILSNSNLPSSNDTTPQGSNQKKPKPK